MAGFVTCGPNEALVVSGCCHDIPLIIPGGRVFVWPLVQSVQKISLNTMTLSIESPKVYTSQGVPISVTGIAQVKIQGQNKEMLKAACEQFLGKKTREIMAIARETLEGHQRAIMCTMSVEEIYKDRKKFSKQVFEVASSDLVNMGITVVSYTIKDIRDDEGYLKALGMARTAEVKRDARIGEAEAKRDAQIQEGTSSQLDKTDENKEPDKFPIRCKFFEAGKCSKGEKCQFSHDLNSPHVPQNFNQKVCRNYLNGNCRYRTKCRFSHPPENELFCSNQPCELGENCDKLLHWQECRHCHKFCLHPRNKRQRWEHRQGCSEFLRAQALFKMTLGVECGICYEEVCTKKDDNTFGILPNCQHSFCFQCITNWRKQSTFENDIKRGCPECRVVSPFIIRSKRWNEGETKLNLVEKHMARMKQIPCRNFISKGKCPFKECLYKHE